MKKNLIPGQRPPVNPQPDDTDRIWAVAATIIAVAAIAASVIVEVAK